MSVIPIRPMSSSFTDGILSKNILSLELVRGNNEDGNPSYALLLLPVSKVNDLKIALATKDTVLENYGQVLATGKGHEPPQELIDDILGLLPKK